MKIKVTGQDFAESARQRSVVLPEHLDVGNDDKFVNSILSSRNVVYVQSENYNVPPCTAMLVQCYVQSENYNIPLCTAMLVQCYVQSESYNAPACK